MLTVVLVEYLLLQSPPVGLLLRLGLRLGGGLLLATEHAKESAASLLQVVVVGAAAGALHVGQILGVLDRFRIDGKQILAASLLPFGEGTRLEGGDTNLAEVLAVLRALFLVLDLLPLRFAHATWNILMSRGGRGLAGGRGGRGW